MRRSPERYAGKLDPHTFVYESQKLKMRALRMLETLERWWERELGRTSR